MVARAEWDADTIFTGKASLNGLTYCSTTILAAHTTSLIPARPDCVEAQLGEEICGEFAVAAVLLTSEGEPFQDYRMTCQSE